jgi:hypothetical protein
VRAFAQLSEWSPELVADAVVIRREDGGTLGFGAFAALDGVEREFGAGCEREAREQERDHQGEKESKASHGRRLRCWVGKGAADVGA